MSCTAEYRQKLSILFAKFIFTHGVINLILLKVGLSMTSVCVDSDLIVIKFGECELAIRVMSSNVSDVSQGSQTTRIKMCDVEILYQTLIRSKFKWIATPGVFCCLSAKN